MDIIEKIARGEAISRKSKVAKAMTKPPSPAEKRAIDEAGKRTNYSVREEITRKTRPETPRQSSREPTRMLGRSKTVVVGRGGETLTRKREGGIDPFHIDQQIIPQGWEYQWNAVTVLGNQDVLADQMLLMQENGWRPVPAERHPGRYMPAGHKGSIVRGGCRLEERPKVLSDEAREEDLRNARQLVSDRNESLQLTAVRGQLPGGFEMGGKYRGTGGNVRISIDQGADIDPASRPETEE